MYMPLYVYMSLWCDVDKVLNKKQSETAQATTIDLRDVRCA